MLYQENRIFTLNEPNAPRLNPALACEIGLNESLLLLQLEFWISISNNERDDQKWTYQSTRDIQATTFPFWSVMTINRAIKSLEAKGLIITTTKYNKLKYDKTRWFTLNFQELSKLKSISVSGYVTGSNQNDTGSKQFDTGLSQDDTTIPETTSETTNKDYDDTQNQTASPEPKDSPKVDPPAEPSSSFSESELISLLATLMALVPEEYQKPSVKKTIERGLKFHSEDYVRLAILYTVLHSNGGTWQKFKAYLGNCIDKGWQSGWEPESAQGDTVDKEATRARFRRMSDRDLGILASSGNQWAIEELERRKQSGSD